MRRDRGSATPMVMAILVFLAAAVAGLVLLIPTSSSYKTRSRSAEEERERLDRAADALLAALSDDPTPEADGPLDPVWTLAASGVDGVSLELRDISSRLNPNYLRKNLLEATSLGNLLAPGVTAQELQQYREDEGLSTSLNHYSKFFRPEAERYLTCYGWANINTTDEFVLRSLYRSLTGSAAGAEVFHGKIQGLLASRKTVSEEDLHGFLSPDADVLEPELSAVPSLNVHFLDAFILEELVAYPAYEIKDAARRSAAILAARDGRELSESYIASTLGLPKDHVLLHYLGVRTWFWEIRASSARAQLTLIVARDPRADRPGEEGRPRFLILERRYGT